MVAAAAAALVAGLTVAPAGASAASPGFVERCGTHFCLDGKVAYFAGANSYDLFTYGAGSGDTETQYMDKAGIDQQFADMAADGVSLVRTWMFSHESWHGFETAQGVMNEQQWDEFDYILYSAHQHGIRVIPTFENYWSAYGGIGTILSWNGLSSGTTANGAFFDRDKCPGCLADYEYEVDYALNRVNHYTGVAYKDDSTVFAWELMNEPRHQDQTPNDNTTGTVFNAWVDTVGAHIRSIDPNHMITTGVEGQGSEYGYGSDNGVPFVATCENQYIDFCSAHIYPTEYWADLSTEETKALVAKYISDAHDVVGKPMFLGEFNTDSADRATYWPAIYSTIESGGGDASAFWWYENREKDGTYGIVKGDPILSIFRDHAAAMQAKSGADVEPTPDPTGTPTPDPTGTPTQDPAVCRVSYHLDDWGSSFNANVTISDDSTTATNGWTLVFTFPGAQTVNSAWNATVTQTGAQVTAIAPVWNSTIPAGGSVSFGLNGSSTGTNGTITGAVLNGSDCVVTAS
ncbi:MAG TPA: cellulose binding domain-containing protein [Luteimicrobium sp.]|nr:cellulose binding domain-containing protein [Luteimicrobium sp.]